MKFGTLPFLLVFVTFAKDIDETENNNIIPVTELVSTLPSRSDNTSNVPGNNPDQVDVVARCYGETEGSGFSTTSYAEYLTTLDVDAFYQVFRYPNICRNAKVSCTMECNTNGFAWLAAAVGNFAGASSAALNISTTGCPVYIELTANRAGQFYVAGFGGQGLSSGSMVCNNNNAAGSSRFGQVVMESISSVFRWWWW